jgi:sugar lactone lactonase YvrE
MHVAIPAVTESNGVAWSPDGATMYYVDSGTQDLLAYDYDLATGKIGASRLLVHVDPHDGVPDGVIVDAEGV